MIIPKLLVEFKGSANGDNVSYPMQHISFYNYQVIVDGKPTDTHFDGEFYYWQRINELGQEEYGALKLFSHGLMGNGIVSSQGINLQFVVQAMCSYSMSIDNEKWNDFKMGFVADEENNRHVFAEFVIPDDPKQSEFLNKYTTIVFSVVQDEHKQDVLHVQFDMAPDFCSTTQFKWIGGEFSFTLDYSKFIGSIYEYDESTPDFHGKKHNLSGSYKDVEFINELKKAVQSYYANKPAQEMILKSGHLNFSKNLLPARSLAAKIDNSVEDLYTLPAPDMENMHQLSFAKLKSLMLYNIDDEWRKWFGEKKPDLTKSETDLLNNPDIKAFLNDKFAVGYLTYAFSQSDDEKIKKQYEVIPNYKNKMDFFWKGSGEHCFASNKGYNLATSALMESAFVSCVPGLSKYLSDNPVAWANQLYNYCIVPFTLNGLALQNTLDGRKRLTHLCTILHCLDHEARIDTEDGKMISYATSLYCKVMDVRFNYIMARFSSDNKEEGIDFLTEYFKQYFNSLITGGQWNDEVLKAALADLEVLKQEFGVDNINALVNKLGDVIADFIDVYVALKDKPLPVRINSWAEKHPKISSKIGRAMTFAVYGFAMMSAISVMMKWNDLKPQEKVQSVVDIVDVTSNIFSDISKYKAASKLTTPKVSPEELLQASSDIRNSVEAQSSTQIAGKMAAKIEGQVADIGAPALGRAGEVAGQELIQMGSLENASSKWLRISKVAGVFARAMTILALGAACVCTGFQIANDFSTGQPIAIKVLDIIEAVANGVAFLIEGGLGIAALAGAEVCSVIPVIGVVVALVGVAIAIVTIFIHRKQPPTPEENFVTDHSVPFIKELDTPSSEWIESQEKIMDHLGTDGKAYGSC